MLAGFAKRSITPKGSVSLAGFDLRKQPSTGVWDDINVSALAIKDDSGALFVALSFDLLGVPTAFCAKLSERIASEFSINPDSIWISATHTHAAPSSVFNRGENDGEYINFLIETALEALKAAIDDLNPAEALIGFGEVAGVASIRDVSRDKSAYDMPLIKLVFKRRYDDIQLIRISCHCTVLDETNTLISRDLAGATLMQIPNGAKSLMLNGACGDLSTRYTRIGKGEAELWRLGGILAGGINEIECSRDPAFGRRIRSYRTEFDVPMAEPLSEAQRRELMAHHEQSVKTSLDESQRRESTSILAVLNRPPKPQIIRRRVGVYAADFESRAFAGVPFEVNADAGQAIERELSAIAGKPVHLICYTNGYEGYLPSGNPISKASSYQDIASPYGENVTNEVLSALKTLVRKLNTEETT